MIWHFSAHGAFHGHYAGNPIRSKANCTHRELRNCAGTLLENDPSYPKRQNPLDPLPVFFLLREGQHGTFPTCFALIKTRDVAVSQNPNNSSLNNDGGVFYRPVPLKRSCMTIPWEVSPRWEFFPRKISVHYVENRQTIFPGERSPS